MKTRIALIKETDEEEERVQLGLRAERQRQFNDKLADVKSRWNAVIYEPNEQAAVTAWRSLLTQYEDDHNLSAFAHYLRETWYPFRHGI